MYPRKGAQQWLSPNYVDATHQAASHILQYSPMMPDKNRRT